MRRFFLVLMAFGTLGAMAGTYIFAKHYYDGLMVASLYRNEKWHGGSREKEQASFLEVATEVLKAQARLKVSGRSSRVFHAKQHGCATGTLEINTSRRLDPHRRTFHGIFDSAATGKTTYPVLVRFSNGLGVVQSDRKPDVRGLAIKILGVTNPETGKDQSIDFTMTNSPIPAGRDIYEFVKFMKDVSRFGSTVGTAGFAALHWKAGGGLIGVTGLFPSFKIHSVATIQYWSGHPYLLGADQGMKLNARPMQYWAEQDHVLKGWGDDYLRADLSEQLRRGDSVRFALQVQLEKSPKTTPIENTLKEWTEKDSPSIEVGEIKLDLQSIDPRLTPHKEDACNRLSFTPGHYVPAHRPLGNMGRGRIFAYRASQLGRGGRASDLTVEEWERLRAEGRQALSK